jgi:hypothetical protein
VAKPYQQIEAKNKKLIAMRNHYESKFEVWNRVQDFIISKSNGLTPVLRNWDEESSIPW